MEVNFSEQFTDIPNGVSMYELGRSCDICNKWFTLGHHRDGRRICPGCVKRLHKILYPELHKEDFMKPILD